MPIMNGFEAASQIKKIYSDDDKIFRVKSNTSLQIVEPTNNKSIDQSFKPLVVALSAFIDEEVEKQALSCGFDMVI
jgi:CheY-like chemotaxis protein